MLNLGICHLLKLERKIIVMPSNVFLCKFSYKPLDEINFSRKIPPEKHLWLKINQYTNITKGNTTKSWTNLKRHDCLASLLIMHLKLLLFWHFSSLYFSLTGFRFNQISNYSWVEINKRFIVLQFILWLL